MQELFYFEASTIDRGHGTTEVWGWGKKSIETRDGVAIMTRVDGSAAVIPVANLHFLKTFPAGDPRIPLARQTPPEL